MPQLTTIAASSSGKGLRGTPGSYLRSGGGRTAALLAFLVICCAVIGAAVGARAEPTTMSYTTAVRIYLPDDGLVERAGLRPGDVLRAAGARYVASDANGGGYAVGSGPSRRAAQAAALALARVWVVRLQDALHDGLARQTPATQPLESRKAVARLRVLRPRYSVVYREIRPSDEEQRHFGADRGAFAGLLVGSLTVLLLLSLRRRGRVAAAGALVAAATTVAAISVAAGRDPTALTVLLAALVAAIAFVTAFGFADGVRWLVWALLAFTPLRGLWLLGAKELDLSNALLLVNLVPPILVGTGLLKLVAKDRPALLAQPTLLRWGLGLSVIAVAADLFSQTVGLKTYVIGLGQYLTYPSFAIIALHALTRADLRRLPIVLSLFGGIVAATVAMEATDVTGFVQAVGTAEDQQARYGGATGSYLHAGIYLGTTSVIALTWALRAHMPRVRAAALVIAVGSLGGLVLTYGRAGIVIFAAAVVVIVATAPPRDRRRVIGVSVVIVALATPAAFASGLGLSGLSSRVASVVNWRSDPGNKRRLEDMNASLRRFKDAGIAQRALGRGIASTGNAGQLTDRTPNAVESYPLKLLEEVGGFGFVLIGGFLLAALRTFWRVARTARDSLARGVAAAGVGLTLDAVAFPTLEVQVVSALWWILLVYCVAYRAEAGMSPAEA